MNSDAILSSLTTVAAVVTALATSVTALLAWKDRQDKLRERLGAKLTAEFSLGENGGHTIIVRNTGSGWARNLRFYFGELPADRVSEAAITSILPTELAPGTDAIIRIQRFLDSPPPQPFRIVYDDAVEKNKETSVTLPY